MKKFLVLGFFLVSCSPSGPHKEAGGVEGLASPSGASIGYDSVKPIFAKYCSACHPSVHGPNWLDYAAAAQVARTGVLYFRIVTERSMPPPTSSQGAQISNAERLAIGSWARAGAPLQAAQAPSGPAPQPSVEEQVPKTVQNCLRCHGMQGPGSLAEARIPVLVGQNEAYLERELMLFKWRKRIDPSNTMNDMAIDLSSTEIHEAAAFFASRPYGTAQSPPHLTAEERPLFDRGANLAQRDCVSCHYNPEFGNRPTDALVPALAGQSKVYLTNQLIYFRGGKLDDSDQASEVRRNRSDPLMNQMAMSLSDSDIEALAFYFANIR